MELLNEIGSDDNDANNEIDEEKINEMDSVSQNGNYDNNTNINDNNNQDHVSDSDGSWDDINNVIDQINMQQD